MERARDQRLSKVTADESAKELQISGMKSLVDFIESHQRFLISTHTVPDGDGIGGEVTLAHYLSKIGKSSFIINHDETPERLCFVDVDHLIHSKVELGRVPPSDAMIILDGNELGRIGSIRSFVEEKGLDIFYIDHHMGSETLKGHHYVDESASSIGEMLYRFLEWKGKMDLIDYPMALGMYVSILTDTNSFRFSRTTAKSHLIAADLISRGVDPEMVYQNIYATHTLSRMSLLGEVLSTIRLDCDGRLAWIELNTHLQERFNATAEEMEGFVDHIMLVKGVEIGAYFREDLDGGVKVSLRSRGKISIHPIAMQFGGGGHKYSAGMMLHGDFREVTDSVIEAMRGLLPVKAKSIAQG